MSGSVDPALGQGGGGRSGASGAARVAGAGAILLLVVGTVMAGCMGGSSDAGAAGRGGSAATGGSGGTTGAAGGNGGAATGGSTAVGGGGGAAAAAGGSGSDAGAAGAGAGGVDGGSTPDGGGPSQDGASSDGPSDGPPAPYSPCPDGSPCKILPLGDSITWGSSVPSNLPGGYRVELFHDALADHKTITFVGVAGQANGPTMVDGMPFPPDNAGYPGWSINMIASLIPMPALQRSPHVILLMAGTNDRTGAADQAAQRLGMLIDKIVAAAPSALLAVAQLIPIPDNATDKAFAPAYNALVPGVVQQRANAGKHVIVVDQYATFDSKTMMSPDNIHPNQLGYTHMGDVWYAAIKSALK